MLKLKSAHNGAKTILIFPPTILQNSFIVSKIEGLKCLWKQPELNTEYHAP